MHKRLNRVNYVTPTNYIELVEGYRELLKKKREALNLNRNKLKNGLKKLYRAQE